MSELRRDPITKRWVIISATRTKRPEVKKEGCPFCPGNEGMTPPEIRVDPDRKPANSSGWQVRVVSNKFPAVSIDEELKVETVGVYSTMTGYGAHEVVIESPQHETQFEDLPPEHVALILNRIKERVLDLYKDDRMKQILVFKNFGKEAGASVAHPHWQVSTLPVIPIHQKEELKGAKTYFDEKKSCLWCDIVKQIWMNIEIRDPRTEEITKTDSLKECLVYRNKSFVAFCPYASRFPYEIHFLPFRHSHFFGNVGEKEHFSEIRDLAEIFKVTIKKLNIVLKGRYPNGVLYNLGLHTSPNLIFRENEPGKFGTIKHDFHWHFELYPVGLSIPAGYEKTSGFYINGIAPEEAAKNLREVIIENTKDFCVK